MVYTEFVTKEGILFAVIFPTKEKFFQFQTYTKLEGRML
jgi:hypothetical protein